MQLLWGLRPDQAVRVGRGHLRSTQFTSTRAPLNSSASGSSFLLFSGVPRSVVRPTCPGVIGPGEPACGMGGSGAPEIRDVPYSHFADTSRLSAGWSQGPGCPPCHAGAGISFPRSVLPRLGSSVKGVGLTSYSVQRPTVALWTGRCHCAFGDLACASSVVLARGRSG